MIPFLLASVALAAAAPPVIEVHGHRGARMRFPENTIPAFEHSLAAGADYLELDVGVTKDGVLVLHHEPYINPEICRDEIGAVPARHLLFKSLTLAEVKKFDCGGTRYARFPDQTLVPGTRIPTLDEVFAYVRASKHSSAKRVGFNIETKIFPDHPEATVDAKEFSRLVVAAFRKSGFLKRIILQSFDPRTLIEAHALEPKLRLSLLVESDGEHLVELAKQAGAAIVSPNWKLLDAERMAKLRAAGLKVVPWTANDPESWKTLRDLKVDAIITDDPEGLIRFLNTPS